MKKLTAIALTAAIVVSAFTISACNDEKNNNVVSPESVEEIDSSVSEVSEEESSEVVSDIAAVESKPEISASKLSEINAFISNYKNIPSFSSSSEGIEAKKISSGKTIDLILDNSSFTFSSLVAQQFKNAASSAGFESVICGESDGTSTYYSSELESAIKQSDVVLMYGDINKDDVATQIEIAQANGIRVLSAGSVGKGEKDHYVDYTIPINYQLAGKLLADWAVFKNKGKVNALAINNSDSMLSSAIYKGFADEFQTYVTSGYCTVVSGSNLEVGNGLALKIKQAVEKDPNLNYVIVLDDSMINDAISGVAQSGKKLGIISTGGSLSAFEAAENGSLEMLVAQSYEWTAYAMVDYALRVLNKSELPQEQDVPVRVVTAESIKDDLNNNTYPDIGGFYEICFGASFLTGYSGLWNL